LKGESLGREQINYYPVYLKLKGKLCLVVGAGKVACRKVGSLLEAGARVTVVSPEVDDELKNLAQQGAIIWKRKEFEKADLEGAFLVVGATGSQRVNRLIFEQAEAGGVLVNIVDDPGLCNFIVPAVFRRGDFQIAVSSAGASPVLVRKVREELELRYGPVYSDIVEQMRNLRTWLKEKLPDEEKRRRFWEDFVDLEFFDTLSEQDVSAKLKERALQCLSRLVD